VARSGFWAALASDSSNQMAIIRDRRLLIGFDAIERSKFLVYIRLVIEGPILSHRLRNFVRGGHDG